MSSVAACSRRIRNQQRQHPPMAASRASKRKPTKLKTLKDVGGKESARTQTPLVVAWIDIGISSDVRLG
ncbi:hypothetical protein EG329_008998 [Mollisiaceae sp. DMI_Dod_QoI]|nr:hypothetical protein EG329_008998 [Helotiales sp. DMI_Dod_QoI]